MGWISKVARSADLASGMMDRLGTPYRDEIMAHPETAAFAYRGAILRCSGCTDQDGCAQLQAEHDHLDHAPSYCRNAAMLERMGRG